MSWPRFPQALHRLCSPTPRLEVLPVPPPSTAPSPAAKLTLPMRPSFRASTSYARAASPSSPYIPRDVNLPLTRILACQLRASGSGGETGRGWAEVGRVEGLSVFSRCRPVIRCSPMTIRVPRHPRVLRLLLGVWWQRFLRVPRGAVEIEVGGPAHTPRHVVKPPRSLTFGCTVWKVSELAVDGESRSPPERGL